MDENNNYTPTEQPTYSEPAGEQPINIGDWLITFLITCIPCIGLVMLFVWAFSIGTPKSKSNWAKAQLIWILIIAVLTTIMYVVMGAAILSAVQQTTM